MCVAFGIFEHGFERMFLREVDSGVFRPAHRCKREFRADLINIDLCVLTVRNDRAHAPSTII